MGYVIVRYDGMLVAPPGRDKSYVENIRDARIFPTKADADRERCVENETVAAVADLLAAWPKH